MTSRANKQPEAPLQTYRIVGMTLEGVVALATTAIPPVGLPAVRWQARTAARAARSPVTAAGVTARAQHVQNRRSAQRATFLELLAAARTLRGADRRAHDPALFCHLVRAAKLRATTAIRGRGRAGFGHRRGRRSV